MGVKTPKYGDTPEHTPMTALYASFHSKSDPKKVVARRLIGYKCEHCGMVFTANGNPSDPKRVEDKHWGPAQTFRNKTDGRRRRAAK